MILKGEVIYLRAIVESDLDHLWLHENDIEARGAYHDMNVFSILRSEAPTSVAEALARIRRPGE